MTTYRPGLSDDCFENRIAECLEDVCYQRGDRATYVDGKGPYCIIVDTDSYKYEDGDRGVVDTQTEICWLKSDCIPIRPRSCIRTKRREFVVTGKPRDGYDGWLCAEVRLTCEHC